MTDKYGNVLCQRGRGNINLKSKQKFHSLTFEKQMCKMTDMLPEVNKFRKLLRSPYVIGQTIISLSCDFYLLLLFPRLISAVGDWMSTILPHIVWL